MFLVFCSMYLELRSLGCGRHEGGAFKGEEG
jgi:hypothetical protein